MNVPIRKFHVESVSNKKGIYFLCLAKVIHSSATHRNSLLMKLHQPYPFSWYFERNYYGGIFTAEYLSSFRRNFSESEISFPLPRNEFSTVLQICCSFFVNTIKENTNNETNKQKTKKSFVFPSNFGISHDTEQLCVDLLFHSIFYLIPSFASFPLALCFNLSTQTQSMFSFRQL